MSTKLLKYQLQADNKKPADIVRLYLGKAEDDTQWRELPVSDLSWLYLNSECKKTKDGSYTIMRDRW